GRQPQTHLHSCTTLYRCQPILGRSLPRACSGECCPLTNCPKNFVLVRFRANKPTPRRKSRPATPCLPPQSAPSRTLPFFSRNSLISRRLHLENAVSEGILQRHGAADM